MCTKEFTEIIFGYGHKNVKATHRSTLEFTKDKMLSRNGDCILITATDKGPVDLRDEFKAALRKSHAKLVVKIEVDHFSEEIHAVGSPNLSLTHQQEIVIRKSDFASNRTLGIHADKAANDLPRELVEKLKNPKQKAKITLKVQV